jgi:hypothetical protein
VWAKHTVGKLDAIVSVLPAVQQTWRSTWHTAHIGLGTLGCPMV